MKNDTVTAQGFAQELFQLFTLMPMGIVRNVLKVLSFPQFVNDPLYASEHVWQLSGFSSAANCSIMRTSILGTWLLWNMNQLISQTELICKVTHFDPKCIVSCVIITSIVASLLNSDKLLTKQEIIEIGRKYDLQIKMFVELAYALPIEILNLDEPNAIGYTLKTLGAGLWAYFHATDFSEGLLSVIE